MRYFVNFFTNYVIAADVRVAIIVLRKAFDRVTIVISLIYYSYIQCSKWDETYYIVVNRITY